MQQAVTWFRKAAEQGNAQAQFYLGESYCRGKGIARDNTQGYVWLSVAAANGEEKAVELRNFMAKQLSESELAAAQKLAGQYFKKYQLNL